MGVMDTTVVLPAAQATGAPVAAGGAGAWAEAFTVAELLPWTDAPWRAIPRVLAEQVGTAAAAATAGRGAMTRTGAMAEWGEKAEQAQESMNLDK